MMDVVMKFDVFFLAFRLGPVRCHSHTALFEAVLSLYLGHVLLYLNKGKGSVELYH